MSMTTCLGRVLTIIAMAGIPTIAAAQTKQETIDFLFGSYFITVNGALTGISTHNNHIIHEQKCIITYSARYYSDMEKYKKFNGRPVGWQIDFNKLFISPGMRIRDDNMQIRVPGETDAVKTWSWHIFEFEHSEAPDNTISSELVFNIDGDDSTRFRLKNAFTYFVSQFCPGKKSAF